MSDFCCDYRDHSGIACGCDAHPQDSLHPQGWCTWCGGRGCPECEGPDENACIRCGANPCTCDPSLDNEAFAGWGPRL